MKSLRLFLGCLAFLILVSACAEAAPSGTAEPYAVSLDTADFVPVIDNPFFPLTPGSAYTYEAATDEGKERVQVEVLEATREVMGITATVVHDTVTVDGELIEDTYDWYAQDSSGNVWYLGEDVSNYEGGRLRDKSGSWEAGVDGALPGIIMFGDPSAHLGETYRQEYYPSHAEDMADLVSLGNRITVPYGTFDDVLKTLDYTPLEPGVQEEKYYARGIGVVRVVNLTTGEEEVLLEFISP